MGFRPNHHSLMVSMHDMEVLESGRRRLLEETAFFALQPRTFALFAGLASAATILRAVRWGLDDHQGVLLFTSSSMLVLVPALVAVRWAIRRVPRRRYLVLAAFVWTAVAITRYGVEVSIANQIEPTIPNFSLVFMTWSIASPLACVALIAGVRAAHFLQEKSAGDLDRSIHLLKKSGESRWLRLDQERARIASSVRLSVTAPLDQLSRAIVSKDLAWQEPDFQQLVGVIAEASREFVRQTSYDMLGLAGRSVKLGNTPFDGKPPINERPPTHPRRFRALSEVRIEPALSALLGIVFLIASVPMPTHISLITVIAGVGSACLILRALAPIAEAVHPHSALPRVVVVMIGNVLGSAGGILIAYLVANALASHPQRASVTSPLLSGPNQVLVFIAAVLLPAAASLIGANRRLWARTEESLTHIVQALDVLDADLARQYERMCAQSAALLHGPIQGRLATISMALRFHGPEVFEETMESCRQLLAQCQVDLERLTQDPRTEFNSASEVLAALRFQWQGLLDISWEISEAASAQMDADPDLLRSFEVLTADLASNATRHGGARRMHVTAGMVSHHIFVEARDNGTGPTAHVQQGVGLVGVLRDGLTVNTDANGWCTVSGLLPLAAAVSAQRYAQH